MYFSYSALMGDGEKVHDGICNKVERVREECGKGRKKKRERKKPVWADMMKHSLLVGKAEAKVIYTSIRSC